MYIFGSLPLTIVGGIVGRRTSKKWEPSFRQTKIPREIPIVAWYRQAPAQFLAAGFLPFSAIYIELSYIFASVWGYKLYTLYGVLLAVFCMLIVVTSFLTIALTFLQLSAEDYRWWWRSFFSGAAVGLFTYVYSVYYYYYKSSMHGVQQTSIFFGYMAIACYSLSLLLGTIGFFSAFVFVRVIYRAIKTD